jgi:hypothetical protein
MERLLTSSKERRRLYRQAKRIWKRYGAAGDAGLVHRARGKAGSGSIAALTREKILKAFAQQFRDFGPTLAAD